MKYYQIKEIKQQLRNNQTPSEKLLWKHIRNRQLLGRKFLTLTGIEALPLPFEWLICWLTENFP